MYCLFRRTTATVLSVYNRISLTVLFNNSESFLVEFFSNSYCLEIARCIYEAERDAVRGHF